MPALGLFGLFGCSEYGLSSVNNDGPLPPAETIGDGDSGIPPTSTLITPSSTLEIADLFDRGCLNINTLFCLLDASGNKAEPCDPELDDYAEAMNQKLIAAYGVSVDDLRTGTVPLTLDLQAGDQGAVDQAYFYIVPEDRRKEFQANEASYPDENFNASASFYLGLTNAASTWPLTHIQCQAHFYKTFSSQVDWFDIHQEVRGPFIDYTEADTFNQIYGEGDTITIAHDAFVSHDGSVFEVDASLTDTYPPEEYNPDYTELLGNDTAQALVDFAKALLGVDDLNEMDWNWMGDHNFFYYDGNGNWYSFDVPAE